MGEGIRARNESVPNRSPNPAHPRRSVNEALGTPLNRRQAMRNAAKFYSGFPDTQLLEPIREAVYNGLSACDFLYTAGLAFDKMAQQEGGSIARHEYEMLADKLYRLARDYYNQEDI
jgi:hypothetical protein